jgi:hypothetical protein
LKRCGSQHRYWERKKIGLHLRPHRRLEFQGPDPAPKGAIQIAAINGTLEEAAEKVIEIAITATTWAEARRILDDLRGAEAPLFHG